MQRICKTCGVKLEDFIFVYQPTPAHIMLTELKDLLLNVDFSMGTTEGNKVSITTRQTLTTGEKIKLDKYFTDKGYVEDVEAENEVE